MSDPLNTIVLASAVGAATGKFVEKAWDSGLNWLRIRFRDHQDKLLENAASNSRRFLEVLAAKVSRLEDSNAVTIGFINSALEEPSFGSLLQKAILGASQTSVSDKHELLAALVAERLSKPAESIFALVAGAACDGIVHLGSNQIRLLGCILLLQDRRISFGNAKFASYNQFVAYVRERFHYRFSYLLPLGCSSLDIQHLDALSCVNYTGAPFNPRIHAFPEGISWGHYKIEMSDFEASSTASIVTNLWKDYLHKVELTSIGQLIGGLAVELMSGEKTNFESWGAVQ